MQETIWEELGKEHAANMTLVDLGMSNFPATRTFSASLTNPRAQSFAMGAASHHGKILRIIKAEIVRAAKEGKFGDYITALQELGGLLEALDKNVSV